MSAAKSVFSGLVSESSSYVFYLLAGIFKENKTVDNGDSTKVSTTHWYMIHAGYTAEMPAEMFIKYMLEHVSLMYSSLLRFHSFLYRMLKEFWN